MRGGREEGGRERRREGRPGGLRAATGCTDCTGCTDKLLLLLLGHTCTPAGPALVSPLADDDSECNARVEEGMGGEWRRVLINAPRNAIDGRWACNVAMRMGWRQPTSDGGVRTTRTGARRGEGKRRRRLVGRMISDNSKQTQASKQAGDQQQHVSERTSDNQQQVRTRRVFCSTAGLQTLSPPLSLILSVNQ